MPYLIDGNNLLGSWGGPAAGGDRRLEVVRRVAEFCRNRGARAVVVFDGAPFRRDIGPQEIGSVSLRFPEAGSDADTVIRTLVDQAPRPGEWTVVTSDKPLYSYVRTRGALVLRAHEWNALERSDQRPGARPRSSKPAASEKPAHERDVSGWLEAFGKAKPVDEE